MRKTEDQLYSELKAFPSLTMAQGQICVTPGVQSNIKAFIQWTRDEIRMGRNPASTPFPINEVADLLEKLSEHNRFVKEETSMLEITRCPPLTNDVKWEDWEPAFIAYLKVMPGDNGVPLAYVGREEELQMLAAGGTYFDMLISMAPLHGSSFDKDNAKVLSIVLKLIMGNERAEAAVKALNTTNDGRGAISKLRTLYLGEGMMQTSIVNAQQTLNKLFYGGEKPPHIWWDKFEQELLKAYAIIDKDAGRQVHTDDYKLRDLQAKIQPEWLSTAKAAVQLEIAKVPPGIDFATALRLYRNAVKEKYPNGPKAAARRINEVNKSGRFQRGGKRQKQGGGRNNMQGRPRNHPDQITITLRNGEKIKYHASYNFSNHEIQNMTQDQRDLLKRQRREYKQRRQNQNDNESRRIQQLESTVASLSAIIGDRSQIEVPTGVSMNDGQSQISQVTTGTGGTSIIGGRRAQALARQEQRRGGQQ